MLTVAVVICTATRERTPLLRAGIDSIIADRRPPDELIVVVDSDETLAIELRRSLPREVDVRLSDAPGLSAARNRGIAAARADVVAFLDDDALAEPGWLRWLVAAFESDPGVLGAGGPVLPQWAAPRRWLPDDLLWVVGCTYAGHRQDAGPVRNPIGCNMAFRRRELIAVGTFATGFGKRGSALCTCEETELALRLERAYGPDRIHYVPEAAVRHHVPAARISWRLLVRRSLSEGLAKGRLHRLYSGGALDSERRYARTLLTRRVPRLLLDGIRRGDRHACQAAFGIVTSLVITSTAFLASSARERRRTPRATHQVDGMRP